MRILHSSLYAIALVSCVLLIVIAHHPRGASRPRSGFLVAFLALEALGFTLEWLMLHPAASAKALWLGMLMAQSFFLAPCLWLFARALTEQSAPRVRELPRWHFVVVGAGIALTMPLIETAHLGTGYINPARVVSRSHSFFIHTTMLSAIALFAAQAAYYLRAALRILDQHAERAKVLFSNLENRGLDTLRLLILAMSAHWFVGIARGLYGLILGRDAGPAVIFAIVEVTVILWVTICVVRGSVGLNADDQRLAGEITEAKYARSALDAPARARIRRKLEEALGARHLHRNGRLTLRTLCEQIRESPHYVSQVISQDLQTTFYDLVNRRRIQDAMAALRAAPNTPVSEIGAAAGFNSKSTFNAAFRLHAGVTPSEYRAAAASGPIGPDADMRT